jgi:DNA-binding XRE family transcriptional regulator
MLGHLSASAELVRGDERFPRGARSGARKLSLAAKRQAGKAKKSGPEVPRFFGPLYLIIVTKAGLPAFMRVGGLLLCHIRSGTKVFSVKRQYKKELIIALLSCILYKIDQRIFNAFSTHFQRIFTMKNTRNFRTGTFEQLRQARESAGLTRKQACALAGVPYDTWTTWENELRGVRPPQIVFSWLSLYVKYKQLVEFFPNSAKEKNATIEMQRGGEQL